MSGNQVRNQLFSSACPDLCTLPKQEKRLYPTYTREDVVIPKSAKEKDIVGAIKGIKLKALRLNAYGIGRINIL